MKITILGTVLAALVLGRVGDTARAKALTDELEKNNPSNTVLKLYWLPTLRAVNELNSGNAAQAVVLLEAAAPYELGEPPPTQAGMIYPAYLRGQAYLASHNGAAAAAEFQKLPTTEASCSISRQVFWRVSAWRGLARSPATPLALRPPTRIF